MGNNSVAVAGQAGSHTPAGRESMSLDKIFGTPHILQSIDEIKEWYHAQRTKHLKEGDTQALLHLLHPRVIFLKTLPYESRLLDVGAGDGSLHILRKWPAPSRTDVRIYAYGLEKGQHYDDLDGYELGHGPEKKPDFPDVAFTAIYCSHFVEHIKDTADFLAWCAARLSFDGRLYLEWPSPQSLTLPARSELVSAGVELTISNYWDDCTHNELPAREAVLTELVKVGFFVEQTGVVRFPFIEEELLAHFAANDRECFGRQAAFWSKTYWTRYVVAAKARSATSDL